MLQRTRGKLTYSNVVSTLCLFLLLGGGAFAAAKLPKNAVKTKNIKDAAVTAPKLAPGAVTADKVAPGALDASKLASGTLGAGGDASGPLSNLKLGNGVVGPEQTGPAPAALVKQPHVADAGCTAFATNDTNFNVYWGLEAIDNANIHSDFGSTCPLPADNHSDRLVAPKPGLYVASAGMLWFGQLPAGDVYMGMSKNDSLDVAANETDTNLHGSTLQNVSGLVSLNAGDYVTMHVRQKTGTAPPSQVMANDDRTFLSLVWVAPN
jgi:hypothetical protein